MNNKISYEEIDEWGRSFETRSYAYKKIHPTYNILTLKITAKSGKRLVLCNPKKPYNEWDLGLFDGHNSKELFEDFFMRMASHSGLIYLNDLDDYGFPVEEWYCKNKKEFDPLERKIDQRLDKELEEFEKEIVQEEIKKEKEKEKEDHTYIDYNSFIYAKNRYVREKAEKTKLNYSITMVVIYTILAIIITTSFFNSEYYSQTSSIMAILWIFAFIAGSVWLGRKTDKKLDEISKRLREEYHNSFSLTDEVVYNQVFKNMVDREVEYLTRNCDRMLIHLIENHSSDIPEEVYELKDKSKLNTSGFVSAISLDNKKALLEKYLDKQANFAREKSITLLNRIKEEGDEAFTKEIVTPSGQIDPLITDILKKHNISVKE